MKQPNYYFALALMFSMFSVPGAALGSTLNTLHFDETNAPADGLIEQGVLFNFNFGNSPSQDAIYGAAYPLSDQLLQDFVLAGPAQGISDPSQAGALTFTFLSATHTLNFAVALTTGADDSISLLLFDALGNALAPVSIATTYDHVNCDPSSQTCLSEAEYSYSGDVAIGQATLNFDGTNADGFAVDNLEFELPEPSSLSMLLLGGAGLLPAWAVRRSSRRGAARSITMER